MPDEPPDGRATLLVSFRCPECAQERAFTVVERDGRLRMTCPECGLDLPARVGPVSDWRHLVEGPPTHDEPDRGRRHPAVP